MMDATHNQPEYSVSELSQILKRSIEDRFSYVRVRGELSGFKRAASGHLYMDLKDDNAVLNAVCWRGVAGKLGFKPEDGLEVIAVGKLTTYPGRSNYQLVVEHLEPAGVGALMALLEKRKAALTAEGLFDAARKKPLPFMPQHIGIITSPTGAVIRDILHRLNERFPVRVTVWPVRVQGEGAAAEITAAIDGFNQLNASSLIPRPDLLIVARGGGSIEDLWCFNEENVVRAAAASAIPLISAVGHETDTTLIDFASDKRAPTPTAAAEIAVPVCDEWRAALQEWQARMARSIHARLTQARLNVDALGHKLPAPSQWLNMQIQKIDMLSEAMTRLILHRLERASVRAEHITMRLHPRQLAQMQLRQQERFNPVVARLMPAIMQRLQTVQQKHLLLATRLQGLDYREPLKRGFALVRDKQGNLVRSVAEAQNAAMMQLQFSDGDVTVSTAKTKATSHQKDLQGSLFSGTDA